jgi:peptide chain release factor 2
VITFDPDSLRVRVADLEARMGEPGFWDDQTNAAQVSSEHSRLTRRLERYDRLVHEYEDARELLSLDGDMADDIVNMLRPLRAELDRLQEDALFTGEYDTGDALMSLHAATGGIDAQDFTEMLLRMYLRWAADRGFQTEILEATAGEEAGLKSATVSVAGENAYGILKAERGKHRLVRLSPFDQAHRRHTSFAQIVVAPLLPDDAVLELDEGDLRIDTYRASGAGGQHVNKTESAIRITHLPSGIVVAVQEERSQHKNKAKAMSLLRTKLYDQERSKLDAERAAARRGQVGSGDRSERIRTYNFPQGRVSDHRINLTLYKLPQIIEGEALGEVIDALATEHQAALLAAEDA